MRTSFLAIISDSEGPRLYLILSDQVHAQPELKRRCIEIFSKPWQAMTTSAIRAINSQSEVSKVNERSRGVRTICTKRLGFGLAS